MTRSRRHGRRSSSKSVMIAVIALVLVAAVAVAGVLLWPKLTGSETAAPPGGTTSTNAPSGAPVADPPVAAAKQALAPIGKPGKPLAAAAVQNAIAGPLANPDIAQFSGIIIDPATGKAMWQKDQGVPKSPASSLKLLTGAALLKSVDPNARLVTKVVAGPEPGDIVFVGGGDVTLSARTEGQRTVYPGAAHVSQLAEQVKVKGVEVKRIILDASYWSGDVMAAGWDARDIRANGPGFITKMVALMVDGDRENPEVDDSKRTGSPAQTAGKALARALGVPNAQLVDGQAPPEAEVLAQVSSQPMSILLSQAMINSDNVLAEALAREVAIARGAPPSFDGATAAIAQALGDMGIDTAGMELYDASGMSTDDLVPPRILGEVLAAAVVGKEPAMRNLLTGLPVAGVSGTLTDRYQTEQSKAGAGWVRAKTGSLGVTYALAGYVPTKDNQVLVFAFISDGVFGNKTRYAQDAVAATLRGCGCS